MECLFWKPVQITVIILYKHYLHRRTVNHNQLIKDMKNIVTTLFIILAGMLMVPQQSMAQWSIGASYEIRNEVPESGFGVRLERSILKKLPVVKLGIRAHFSYFNDKNGVTEDNFSYGEITNYDFGLAAIGGASLGLIKPYVGLGLGATTFDGTGGDFQNFQNTSDSPLFWNALVGAQLSPIPMLKPFVEYRFQQTDQPQFARSFESNGRFVLGLSIQF